MINTQLPRQILNKICRGSFHSVLTLSNYFLKSARFVFAQEQSQIVDLFDDGTSDVGVAHAKSFLCVLENNSVGKYVNVIFNGVARAFERLVRRNSDSLRIVYQRVACDSRCRLIRLTEAAVNYDYLAARLYRLLAVTGLIGI